MTIRYLYILSTWTCLQWYNGIIQINFIICSPKQSFAIWLLVRRSLHCSVGWISTAFLVGVPGSAPNENHLSAIRRCPMWFADSAGSLYRNDLYLPTKFVLSWTSLTEHRTFQKFLNLNYLLAQYQKLFPIGF